MPSQECPRCWRVDSHSLARYFASHPKPVDGPTRTNPGNPMGMRKALRWPFLDQLVASIVFRYSPPPDQPSTARPSQRPRESRSSFSSW